MSQLLQWFGFISVFMAVWTALVTKSVSIAIPDTCMNVLYYLPIYLLMSFACYSLAVVGYGVATFNNCEKAAEELKQEIQEAKKYLKRKGFKFT